MDYRMFRSLFFCVLFAIIAVLPTIASPCFRQPWKASFACLHTPENNLAAPLHFPTSETSLCLLGEDAPPALPGTDLPPDKLTPVKSGPGLFICEPVIKKGNETLSDFGIGVRRWMQFTLGDNPELGQMPRLETEKRVMIELKSSHLQFSLEQGLKAANIEGVTHVAVGMLSGNAQQCTLAYRLYALSDHKSVGEALIATGTTTKVLAQLPGIMQKMLLRLGVSTPKVKDKLDATPEELSLLGKYDWANDVGMPDTAKQRMKTLAARLPVAGYFFLYVNSLENKKAVAESLKRLMGQAPNNFYLVARILDEADALAAPYEATFRLDLQRYPNNAVYSLYSAWRQKRDAGWNGEYRGLKHCAQCAPRDANRWVALGINRSNAYQEIRQGRVYSALKQEEIPILDKINAEGFYAVQHAAQLDPLSGIAWHRVASFATFAGQPDIADAALWKGIALEPGYYRLYDWGLQMYQPKWFGDAEKLAKVANLASQAPYTDGVSAHLMIPGLRGAGFSNLVPTLYTRIVEQLRAEIKREPTRADLHIELGKVFQEQGKVEETVQAFQAAVHANPEDPDAHFQLGATYARKGQWDDSLAELHEAIRLAPEEAEYHYMYGAALWSKGNPSEGDKEIREAIRLRPDWYWYHYNYSIFLEKQGKRPEAEKEAQEAVRLGPYVSIAHLRLCSLLATRNAYAEAVEEGKKGLALDPNDTYGHLLVSNIYGFLNDEENCERESREAGRVSPNSPLVHLHLGNILFRRGKKEEARAEWKQAVALGPNDPNGKSAAEKLKNNP